MNSIRYILKIFRHQFWCVSCLAAVLLLLPMATYADPPPWAPAWGSRNQNEHEYEHEHEREHEHEYRHGHRHHGDDEGDDEDEDEDSRNQYRTDNQDVPAYNAEVNSSIQAGTCNRQLIGSLLGGAAGGYVGSQFGQGNGKLATTAAGALLGFIIGKNVGQSMDDVDVRCTGYALEDAADRQKVVWKNPNNGREYSVTPTRTFKEGGRYCRDYTTRTVLSGRTENVRAKACRNPDGSWQVVK